MRYEDPPMSDDECRLRRMLFLKHTHSDCYLYCDDGELQCNTCGIDFRRDSTLDIETKLGDINLRRVANLCEQDRIDVECLGHANHFELGE